jgi:ubiquinone/menaquinone biosynthesis C-methylase UbiE
LANQQLQTQDTKAHFDRLSTRWSCNYDSRSGAMRQRISRFIDALAGLPRNAHLLDFGCGSGDITRALAAEGFAMAGIDLSSAMIATARRQSGTTGIDWAVAEPGAVALPFADMAFDGALASSVLEYHPDPAAQLAELARVLKPGGVLVFTVPDMSHASRKAEVKWRVLALSWVWPVLKLTPRHTYFEYLRVSVNRWPLETWLAVARDAGFIAEPFGERDGPLAMIRARKPA